jgi:hypothetical protein
MKNILFLIVFAISSTVLLAQEPQASPPAGTQPQQPAAPVPAPAPAPAPKAAEADDSGMSFGFKLTPTYNWMTIDRDGYEAKGGYIGYTYGIMMDFKIAKNYFFSTGLEYAARGGKFESDSLQYGLTTTSGEVTQRLAFIDIPLALKLKTNEIGYSRYYASFGLMPGFLVKANQDIDYENSAYEDRDKRQNSSDFGFFNLGLNVGLGWEYRFSGNTALTVGLGYHNGFIDLWSEDNAKMTTNFLTLNLGMFF